MKFRFTRRLAWILVALVLALLFSLPACNCGRRGNRQAGPGSPFDLAKNKDGAGQAPADLFAKDLDPKLKEVCRDTCKAICGRGNQCQIAGFDKPVKCFKVCGAMCGRGLLDEESRQCIKPDSDCEQVKQCLAKVTEKLKVARAKMQQGQAGGAFGIGGGEAKPAPENPEAEQPEAGDQ